MVIRYLFYAPAQPTASSAAALRVYCKSLSLVGSRCSLLMRPFIAGAQTAYAESSSYVHTDIATVPDAHTRWLLLARHR